MVVQIPAQNSLRSRLQFAPIMLYFTLILLLSELVNGFRPIPSLLADVHENVLDNLEMGRNMVDQTLQSVDEQFWAGKFSSPASKGLDSPLQLSWIRKHLSTKSPYPHEDKRIGPVGDIPEGYELVQLHLICRHGTRFPSSSKAIAFQKLAEKLKQADIPNNEWLQKWPSAELYPAAKGNLLSGKGDSDLYRIGRRFAIRYKDFLDRYPYDANTYDFQSSSLSRSTQSAYAFSVGLFEGRHVKDQEVLPVQPVGIFTLPRGLDKELAVKYACPRWRESVKGGSKASREKLRHDERFLPELAERISHMFSVKDKVQVNVTTKDVETIYGICGFEVSFHDNDQTWCQLLQQSASHLPNRLESAKSDFLNLEISNDLGEYYNYGPGIPFNKHLGCELATSLSNGIESALDFELPMSSSKRNGDFEDDLHNFRGIFKFGHAETIMFLSSFLGLYDRNGIPLRGDMTPEQYAQREFRTSKITPFSANIAFEVYRPKLNTSHRKKRIEHYEDPQESHIPMGLVRLLVNEEPTIIPGCGSDYFCEWSILKEILHRSGSGCNFDSCCASQDPLIGEDQVCLSVEPVSVNN
ncbi:PHOsphatase [Entomortierella lignicola]|nr:PHOsphatase [Entomortierella lignicola]